MADVIQNTEIAVNDRQDKFCQLYVSEDFFGNGVETYLEVYDIDRTKPNWYKTACSAASRLLSNVNVCQRINELLKEAGLSNEFIDKQLLFLVTQHADFGNKLGAIKEYNKLKKRVDNEITLILPKPILDVLLQNDSNPKDTEPEEKD